MTEAHEKRIREHMAARAEAERNESATRQRAAKLDRDCRALRGKIGDLEANVAELLDRCAILKIAAFERCKQIAEKNGHTQTAVEIAELIAGSQ